MLTWVHNNSRLSEDYENMDEDRHKKEMLG